MAQIFSDEWMQNYKQLWNSDTQLVQQLADSGFTANVAFGIKDEEKPRVVMQIQQGLLTNLGAYTGENLQWDLRATPDFWVDVSKSSPSLMKLGLAYTSRQLKFMKGDYSVMVKDPGLSSAFIKSFKFMSAVFN
jgi:hypothetical protein